MRSPHLRIKAVPIVVPGAVAAPHDLPCLFASLALALRFAPALVLVVVRRF